MNRLVDTVHLALSIGNATQTGTGKQAQRTRDNTGFITDNVTKQVTRDNNPIQFLRVLDHNHRRRVNQLMPDLHLRELLRHHLRHRLPPQPTRREHVGLVQAPHRQRGVMLQRHVGRETGDALDLGARVRLRVQRESVTVIFLALAEVDTTGEFTDDVEVDAAADVGAEGGALDQGGGGEVTGTEVAKGGHFFAELEETLFGADDASSPFLFFPLTSCSCPLCFEFLLKSTYRSSNGTQENRIGVLCSVQSLIGQGVTGCIN